MKGKKQQEIYEQMAVVYSESASSSIKLSFEASSYLFTIVEATSKEMCEKTENLMLKEDFPNS